MRFYYGTDPIRLHDKCLAEVAEFVANYPHKRAYIVVPERLKADSERRYLEKFDDSGLMMAEVVSFTRFAFRMLEMTGGLAIRRVSRSTKMMLIQYILRRDNKAFRQFSRYGIYSSFSREIDQVMGDFRRYNWSCEQLRDVAEKIPSGRTKDKMADFALLTRELDLLYKERQLTDQEEDMKRLIGKLERLCHAPHPEDPLLQVLAESAIWISGFGDVRPLTPQETHLTRLLEELAAMLTVTLCLDQPDHFNGNVLYVNGRESKHALGSLITNKNSLRINDQRAVFPTYEKAFSGVQLTETDTESVHKHLYLIEADDRILQWRYIAGEIVRLHRLHGYRWRDMSVALTDTQSIALMRSVFAEYGLADFVSVDQEPANTPLFFYLRNLMRLLGGNDSSTTFLEYLRTGLTSVTTEQCDALGNYILATGKYSLRQLYEGISENGECRIRDRILLKADDTSAVMNAYREVDEMRVRADGKAAGEIADLLLQYLNTGKTCVRIKLQDLIDDMTRHIALEAAALNLAKAWDLTINQLSEIRQLLPEQELTMEEFSDMLLAPFIGMRLQTIPIGVDRVLVAPLAGIYLHDSKITFIADASADSFPGLPPDEGMLNNRERDMIMANSDGKLPQHRKTAQASLSFQAAQIMGGASDRVYLCAATTESDHLSAPQRLFRKLLPENTVHVDSRHANTYLSWPGAVRRVAANDHDPIVVSLKRAVNELRAADPERYAQSSAMQDGPDAMDQAIPLIILSPEAAATAIGRIRGLSATNVARYHSCPYQFYATNMLRLRERDEYLPDAADRGTMMHAIFEVTVGQLRRVLSGLPQSSSEESVNRAIEAWRGDLTGKELLAIYRNNAELYGLNSFLAPDIYGRCGIPLLDRMTAALDLTAAHYRRSHYRPAALEWHFPKTEALMLTHSDIKIPLTGIVDRVDTDSRNGTFRIVDYKTGKKSFSEKQLLAGTDIQLPLYLRAWWSQYPEQRPQEVGFLTFESKEGKSSDRFFDAADDPIKPQDYIQYRAIGQNAEGLKAMADYAMQKSRDMLEKTAAGIISPSPAVINKVKPCEWCEYKDLCRLDERRPQRQRDLDFPDSFDWTDAAKMAAEKPLTEKRRSNHGNSMDTGTSGSDQL